MPIVETYFIGTLSLEFVTLYDTHRESIVVGAILNNAKETETR